MTRKVAKYRQRLHRSQCANSSDKKVTPRKKVKKVLKGQSVTPVVRKKLLFAEVMTDQIKESYEKEKNFTKRHDFVDKLNGDIIKKYRCVNKIKLLTSARIIHKYRFIQGHEKKIFKKKLAVKSFLEQDENSKVSPGKKETITFKKEKKQKRYLNNILLELHKKFNALQPDMRMSYALFCKFRPFWIVTPNIKNRDSRLCVIHENFSLLIKKLKVLKIIKENSPREILASLCCQVQESCLEKKCPKCKPVSYTHLDVYKRQVHV